MKLTKLEKEIFDNVIKSIETMPQRKSYLKYFYIIIDNINIRKVSSYTAGLATVAAFVIVITSNNGVRNNISNSLIEDFAKEKHNSKLMRIINDNNLAKSIRESMVISNQQLISDGSSETMMKDIVNHYLDSMKF